MKGVNRGDPFITFSPRGEVGLKKWPIFANDSTDRLREMRTKGQNPGIFANVTNGCPLRKKSKHSEVSEARGKLE